MKKIIIFSTMAAVLITAISVAFTSCNKDDEKESAISSDCIMGKWQNTYNAEGKLEPFVDYEGCLGPFDRLDCFITTTHYIEFKTDGTYSYVSENKKINGTFKIVESKEGMYSIETFDVIQPIYGSVVDTDAKRFKMQVTGGSEFDHIVVYHFYSAGILEHIIVHLYSGVFQIKTGVFELRTLGSFRRSL